MVKTCDDCGKIHRNRKDNRCNDCRAIALKKQDDERRKCPALIVSQDEQKRIIPERLCGKRVERKWWEGKVCWDCYCRERSFWDWDDDDRPVTRLFPTADDYLYRLHLRQLQLQYAEDPPVIV